MNTGYLLALLAASFSLSLVGAAFKIMHWTGGDIVLLLSRLGMAIAGLLLVLKLLRTAKPRKP